MIDVRHCLRCDRDFVMRPNRKTSRCSLCRSRYWDRPRTGKWLARGSTNEERFWAKVNQGLPHQCWIWIGAVARRSGIFHLKIRGKRKMISAPRFAYFLRHGKHLSSKLYACHTCDNPLCVNPAHIFAGTSQDNSTDMVLKGRSCAGPLNRGAKLTSQQVQDIRKRYKHRSPDNRALVAEYGVDRHTISRIGLGYTWRNF